jgi:hypothetical protein
MKKAKKKEKKENRISSPIFTFNPQFPILTPIFPNFNEVQKEGMKSAQGTGLGAGLGSNLQKTFKLLLWM